MPRPKIPRRICSHPQHRCFKPNGIPLPQLEQVMLARDEFEALRLVDREGLQQQQAAAEMGYRARRWLTSSNGHALSCWTASVMARH
ncbi:DUF134 domain-containing protein [Edwardsiella tarda]|uniref:DUF134 domain-containing protein n=1 Tax=Edwardsiella tarda TaxID=636 RepID=UPI0020A37AF8|nr:DUF134 domain-containing protein [Edwardsiella tarda]